MKDFITYDIKENSANIDVYKNAVDIFPDFEWRRGDSDSQGRYISGRNQSTVTIKIWLGESPVEMSICFRDVWSNDENRKSKKQQLIDIVEKHFIPSIGFNTRKSEFM